LIRESHAIFLALWEDDPYAARSLEGIMRSMEAYGDYLVKNDRPWDALSTYTQFLDISERLHAFNPMNYARTRALAIAHAKVGRVRFATGDHGGGLQALRHAFETMKTLDAEARGTADEVLVAIAGFARNAATTLLRNGEFDLAIAPYDLAVEAYQLLGERRTDVLTRDLGRTIRNRAWTRYNGFIQGPEALADFELANTYDPRTDTHIAAALEASRVLANLDGAEADLDRYIASLDPAQDAEVIGSLREWLATYQQRKE
ncbi:MAG: hypothetical protein KDA28_15950, partial [Phycisphaerales bacterium]|nr:hypothetical protein [Phycisphaerales bacterium]